MTFSADIKIYFKINCNNFNDSFIFDKIHAELTDANK